MDYQPTRFKPVLWRRLLVPVLLCALLPMGLLSLLWLLSSSGSKEETGLDAAQFDSALEIQFDSAVAAQAQRINARLGEVEAAVLQMQALSQQVLGMPDVFAGKLPSYLPFLHNAIETSPASPIEGSSERQGNTSETDDTKPPPVEEHPLDNPVYYAVSDGGALRKQIDDGHSAFFLKAKLLGAAFTQHDAQRLFASAALDPLLSNAASIGGSGAQAYVVTSDSLLRTYPYLDLSMIEDDKDLTALPLYAWSQPKANSRGIVWAGPYLSRFTGAWVVSCMAEINVGGRMLGVTGVELPLAGFKDQLLSFSLGRSSAAWLMESNGLVIACQEQAPSIIGLAALADAGLPDEKNTGDKLKSASTITADQNSTISALIDQASTDAAGTKRHEEGVLLRTAKVDTTGWLLCGQSTSSLLQEAYDNEASSDNEMRRMLVWIAAVLGLALLIAFGVSWLEARRISQPLAILTQQVRQAAIARSATSVVISDESEVGALAHAVQELVDQLGSEATEEQPPPDATPPADESPENPA